MTIVVPTNSAAMFRPAPVSLVANERNLWAMLALITCDDARHIDSDLPLLQRHRTCGGGGVP